MCLGVAKPAPLQYLSTYKHNDFKHLPLQMFGHTKTNPEKNLEE